ncbi:MAG: 30S ribosomal protein S4 [bacterium]
MARYTGPKCRLCRLEGEKLFLKGERCLSDMCALTRRQTPPGQHGAKRRRKVSEYGLQLREKQKVKRFYSILEKPFKNYYKKALVSKGSTGEALLCLLERRLDNVCALLGWGLSRSHARQLVRQGKVFVNQKQVAAPAFMVKPQDELEFRGNDTQLRKVEKGPAWLKAAKKKASVLKLPQREEVTIETNDQLIVEFYSR